MTQSSVEIYGIIDQGVANTSGTLTEGSVSFKATTVNTGLQSGLATQRIGFRGTEDLGQGMKAIFQIESSLSAGSAGENGFGSRPTFVGLSGGFGTLTLGRQDTPLLKAVVPQLAGGANNAVGQLMWSPLTFGYTANNPEPSSTGLTTANATAALGFGRMASQTTIDKAINYITPNISGLTAEVQYGNSTTKNELSTASELKAATVDRGLNLKYSNGPLTFNAAQHINKVTTDSLEAAKTNTKYAGVTFDAGVANLSFQRVADLRTNAGAQVYSNKGMQAGVQIPMGAVGLFASVGSGTRTYGADSADIKFKQNSYQMGATYSFSKRTKLYGIYGSTKLKSDSVSTANVSYEEKQYAVGVNHSF